MAKETRSYPYISSEHWWKLRKKAVDSPSTVFSPSVIASILKINENNAQNNVLPGLKVLDIINDEYKLTNEGHKWRLDEKYPEYCSNIIDKIYPDELKNSFRGSDVNRDEVNSFFLSHSGKGTQSAKKYTITYMLLNEGNPAKGNDITSSNKKEKSRKTETRQTTKKENNKDVAIPVAEAEENKIEQANSKEIAVIPNTKFTPKIHIDVQVHISPESTPEQIEKIFEMMAKHLNLNENK